MSKYLLDTSVLIWTLLSSSDALSGRALEILKGKGVERFVSAVSLWEIAIKYSIGKLPMDLTPKAFSEELLQSGEITCLDVTFRHAVSVADLPFHHKDPFDRLLIAQAQCEGLPILTPDANFKKYDVEVVW